MIHFLGPLNVNQKYFKIYITTEKYHLEIIAMIVSAI